MVFLHKNYKHLRCSIEISRKLAGLVSGSHFDGKFIQRAGHIVTAAIIVGTLAYYERFVRRLLLRLR